MSFRNIDGVTIADTKSLMMEVLTRGMLSRERVLELTQEYILFLQSKNEKIKRLAQYHQFLP
ncbi:hypothetical protein [uncultured Cetobacterium sp.]|uniref:hypothetical protein n=1 Tax=uncultured Cetobacterium sp. TaxID=527638 RepID=UPI00262099A7|nr:hypothetical protein [uncultured Cetobacterium sp.]